MPLNVEEELEKFKLFPNSTHTGNERLGYGKYKGHAYNTVPTSYLIWLVRNNCSVYHALRELQVRGVSTT
jgi:Putative quorum-sensing-regulated virulence factor